MHLSCMKLVSTTSFLWLFTALHSCAGHLSDRFSESKRERELGCEDSDRERGWVIKIIHHHHLDWAELKAQNLNRYLGCISKQVYPLCISTMSSQKRCRKAMLVYSVTITLQEGIQVLMMCSTSMRDLGWNAANKLELKVLGQRSLSQNLFWQRPLFFPLKDTVCLKLAFMWVCSLGGCFR